jgi:hypothetical protein
MVFGESDAEAGYRRAGSDWSRYTGRRRYNQASTIRSKKSQHKPQRLQPNKAFAKRISSAKKNPFSPQYPAKPDQPLGLIINVGDQRKTYQKQQQGKKPITKVNKFSDKKFKKILKKKGLRGKVRLVRRKPILRPPTLPQKTFHPKKGNTFGVPNERVFNEFYPSGTIGHVLLSGEATSKLFSSKRPQSSGSYRPPKQKRPRKKPSVYKPPKKQQSYKPAKKPQQSYKPAPKPQQSYKPAPKPQQSYKPAKKPQNSYNPPAKKPQQSIISAIYGPPKKRPSYKPAKPEPVYKPEPEYKPEESSYNPPEQSYKPAEPVYKPEPEYKPSYEPDLPKNVYKPEPQFEHSYEPEEATSYKPPQVDYKQPEYQQEVTSYKPPADAYEPQQGFNEFPNFPMPDFSSFLKASFEPSFSFGLPKLNSKDIYKK